MQPLATLIKCTLKDKHWCTRKKRRKNQQWRKISFYTPSIMNFIHFLTLSLLFSSFPLAFFWQMIKFIVWRRFVGNYYLSIFINFNFGSFVQSHCTQSIVPMHMLFNFIWHNTFIKFSEYTLQTNNEKSYPNFTELKMYLNIHLM